MQNNNNKLFMIKIGKNVLIAMSAVLSLTSCDDLFDTHPYDVNFSGERDINAKNIKAIESMYGNKDTLRVAFISDTHGWYSDTKAEIADINKHTNIDFVVHCGDLTDTGTAKEYEWTRDIMSQLRVPYVVLIGNHDFLGTGDQAYTSMFGDMDFSFTAARVKFVCLNTNATEYDYMAAVPNFDYMESVFTKDTANFDRTIVIMHAPPYSDQFNNNVCKAFRRYLDLAPGLMCCIYGHNHNDKVSNIYGDDLVFYSIDCPENRNYRIFTITKDSYEMEQVYF